MGESRIFEAVDDNGYMMLVDATEGGIDIGIRGMLSASATRWICGLSPTQVRDLVDKLELHAAPRESEPTVTDVVANPDPSEPAARAGQGAVTTPGATRTRART